MHFDFCNKFPQYCYSGTLKISGEKSYSSMKLFQAASNFFRVFKTAPFSWLTQSSLTWKSHFYSNFRIFWENQWKSCRNKPFRVRSRSKRIRKRLNIPEQFHEPALFKNLVVRTRQLRRRPTPPTLPQNIQISMTHTILCFSFIVIYECRSNSFISFIFSHVSEWIICFSYYSSYFTTISIFLKDESVYR